MGLFDRLLGKKQEAGVKPPENRDTLKSPEMPPKQPAQNALSGEKLAAAITADTNESKRSADTLRKAIFAEPGSMKHGELQNALKRAAAITDPESAGRARGVLELGGETPMDARVMAADAGIVTEKSKTLDTSKVTGTFDKRDEGEGAGMFRLEDLEKSKEAPDQKRAA